MDFGTILTRASVWMALLAYAITSSLLLVRRGEPCAFPSRTVKWIWTVGCAFFLLHVWSAFTFFHDWSHAAAYRETARQTAAMTGLNWGGGLYLNYLFAAGWTADVVAMSLFPVGRSRLPRGLAMAWHLFFFFMVFNGAVVFANGPVRWLGLGITGTLGVLWFWKRRRLKV